MNAYAKSIKKIKEKKYIIVDIDLLKRGQGVSNTLPFKGRGCTNPLKWYDRKQRNL